MKIDYRPIEKSDMQYRDKWLNDPETNKYLGSRTRLGTDLDFHLDWFDRYVKEKTKNIFIILVDDKPIGQVGLTDIDTYDNSAELYIVIGEKKFRGKGIGEKAVRFIINYGFDGLNLHRIYLGCFEDNTPGVKCYEKCGFKKEGIIVDRNYKDGKYYNEVRMGLINPNG